MGNEKKAQEELQAALEKMYGMQAPTAWVYGSYARGEADEDSDIDVLLLYSEAVEPGQEIDRLSGVLSDLNLRYGVLISLLPLYEKDYGEALGPLWQNIQNDRVPVDAA